MAKDVNKQAGKPVEQAGVEASSMPLWLGALTFLVLLATGMYGVYRGVAVAPVAAVQSAPPAATEPAATTVAATSTAVPATATTTAAALAATATAAAPAATATSTIPRPCPYPTR